MMSSMPARSSVPGAMRAMAPRSCALRRGSSSDGVRVKPRSTALPSRLGLLPFVWATNSYSNRSPDRVGLLHAKCAMGGRAPWRDHVGQAQLRAFLEPALGLRRGPESSGQADFAEGGRGFLDACSLGCARDGEGDGEIGAGLVDADSAGDVDEDVRGTERDAGMSRENGDDHRQALRVDAGADSSRHGQVRGRDERLDLEEQRAGSLEGDGDGGSRFSFRAAEEHRRVRDSHEAGAGHLEDAELVRGAEAVLRGAQHTVLVVAVALELEDAVDEVLE